MKEGTQMNVLFTEDVPPQAVGINQKPMYWCREQLQHTLRTPQA
jgi:hypothetical protein